MRPTKDSIHPDIDKRTYHIKEPAISFFCPLCSMPREIGHSHRLSLANIIQITLISVVLVVMTVDTMQAYSIIFPFVVWFGFEAARRILFKKEIPCPHCGFDATWYKRDVKVARRLVSEFWTVRNQPPVTPPQSQKK